MDCFAQILAFSRINDYVNVKLVTRWSVTEIDVIPRSVKVAVTMTRQYEQYFGAQSRLRWTDYRSETFRKPISENIIVFWVGLKS